MSLRTVINQILSWFSRQWTAFKEWRKNRKITQPRQGPHRIDVKPGHYRAAVVASILPFLILAVVLWANGAGIHMGSFTLPYWLFVIAGALPYWIGSCFFVQTDEFGGITVLETPALEKGQGFTYAPLWLTELHRFPRAMQQDQFPGEPEQISNMPDDEADRTKSKLLEPIRITTGGPEKGGGADDFKDDLLNERLTFEPTATVQWQVQLGTDAPGGDQGFFEFYVNISGKSWPEKYRNVLQRMRDTIESSLNIEMSKHSAAWAVLHKEELTGLVRTRVAEAVQTWGIVICEVTILNLVPSHAVNKALGAIPEAKANALATGIGADAERNRQVVVAEGKAKARVMELESEGKGLAAAAQALGISAADYRAGEIAPKILGDKVIILGEDGIAKAMAIGKTIMEGVK